MDIVLIAIAAAIASLLTSFSGFGLGTILTPVFVIFFPVETAIALTGIVHLLNNFFKFFLTYKKVNWKVALKFGATAIAGAFIGAWLLLMISNAEPIYSYSINNKVFFITPVKLAISILLIIFSLFEIIPFLKNISL